MILILERLALIPAGLLLFLPVRNQLRCSRVRMLVIVGALLAVVIPA